MNIYDYWQYKDTISKVEEELFNIFLEDYTEKFSSYFRGKVICTQFQYGKNSIDIQVENVFIHFNSTLKLLSDILNGYCEELHLLDLLMPKLTTIDISENPRKIAEQLKWWNEDTVLNIYQTPGRLSIFDGFNKISQESYDILKEGLERLVKDYPTEEFTSVNRDFRNLDELLEYLKKSIE